MTEEAFRKGSEELVRLATAGKTVGQMADLTGMSVQIVTNILVAKGWKRKGEAFVPDTTDIDPLRDKAGRLSEHSKQLARVMARYDLVRAELARQVDHVGKNAALLEERAKLLRQLAEVDTRLGKKPKAGAAPEAVSDSKAARAWAIENGIDVPKAGRLPKAVLAAYEEATS